MTSLLKVLLLFSWVTLAQAQWEAARRKLKEMDQKVQQNFARDFDEEAVGSWWGWMDNFIQEADAEVSKLAQESEQAFLQTLKDFLPNFTPEFPPNLQMIGKSILSYLADEVEEFKDFVMDALEEEFTELVHGIEEDCKDVIDGITDMFDGDLMKTLKDFEAVAQGMDSNCFSPLWNVAHNLGLNTGSSSNGEESAVGDKWEWEVAGSTDYIGEQFSLGIAYAVTLSQRIDRIETKDNIFPLPKGSVQGQGQLLLGGGDYVKVDDSGNIEETKLRFEAGFQTQVAACVDIMDSPFLSCEDALTDGTDGVGAMVPDLSFSFNKGPPDGQQGFGATVEIGIPIGEYGALHIGLAWTVNPDGTCPFSGISFAYVPTEHKVSILAWATHANYWPINWLTFDWDLDQIQTKDTGEGKMKSVLPHMAGKTPSKICMFESAKENKKPTDDDTPNQWAPCKNSDDCKQYNVEVTSDGGMAAWKTETNAIRYCNQWEQCGGFWKKQDGHFWAMDKKAASKLQPADDSTGTFLKSCSLNNHASVSDESGCECAGEDGDKQDSGSYGNQCTVEGNDGVAWCYVKDHTKCRAPHNGYSDAFGDHSDKWWSEEPCKRNLCKCRGADGADDGVTGSTCTFKWDDKSDIVRRKAQAWCYLPYSDNVYNCPGATISGNNDDNGYQQYWSYEPCKDYTGTAENSADRENSVAGVLPDKENSVGDGDEDESHVMWPASQSWNTDDAITLDPSSLVNFHYGSSASGDAPSDNDSSMIQSERMIQSVAAADTMNNRVILFFAFIGTCAIILQFVDCARKSACPTHDFSPIEDEI